VRVPTTANANRDGGDSSGTMRPERYTVWWYVSDWPDLSGLLTHR
jgi:hypothetical protein